jgi:hypothetical protein
MAFDRRPDSDPGRAHVGSRVYSGRFDAVVSSLQPSFGSECGILRGTQLPEVDVCRAWLSPAQVRPGSLSDL